MDSVRYNAVLGATDSAFPRVHLMPAPGPVRPNIGPWESFCGMLCLKQLMEANMKRFFLAALVIVLAAPLTRDGSWTTDGYAAMLRNLDELQNVAPLCDCADPAPHCVEICDYAAAGGKECGTAAAHTRQLLRKALTSGFRPDVVDSIRWSPTDFYPLIELRNLPSS